MGPHYLAIALPTLWLGSMTAVAEAYFRSQKASTFLVSVGLAKLLANIGLNIYFVVVLELGLTGVLWGNFLSGIVGGVWLTVALWRKLGGPQVDRTLVPGYWRFGWPLVVYGLLAAVMHEADRFLLRVFVDLHDVGLYSVGYQIGQGVNTLIIVPFTTIWSVMVYEIAKESDAFSTYARVFKYFVYGLSLIMLAAAMFAAPILSVIAPSTYLGAADIVPIICLGYLFFSLHEHFKIPTLLNNRTISLLPVISLAAVLNVFINLALIPRFHAFGAAWATVATFAVFSFAGLKKYRQISKIPYDFARCGAAVVGVIVTYGVFRLVVATSLGMAAQVLLGSVVWCAWAFSFSGLRSGSFCFNDLGTQMSVFRSVAMFVRW